jgi:hypothetical protein
VAKLCTALASKDRLGKGRVVTSADKYMYKDLFIQLYLIDEDALTGRKEKHTQAEAIHNRGYSCC